MLGEVNDRTYPEIGLLSALVWHDRYGHRPDDPSYIENRGVGALVEDAGRSRHGNICPPPDFKQA